MRVAVSGHPASLEHDTGRHHPERPDRVVAVRRGVEGSGLEVIELEAPRIDRSELAAVHKPSYIDLIEAICASGGGAIDLDTILSAGTWEAALRSAGAVWQLAQELSSVTDTTGFAICRPPGHHALPDQAMGFCIFNNVAVTAALLRAQGNRVAILDWDAHHGNGTQTMVGDDPAMLYVSLHQDYLYPFQGHVEDIEAGEAKGTVINIPLPAGTAGGDYRKAWGGIVIPVVRQFQPDWVLISAGYDAHINDRLAGLALRAGDYGWMAAHLAQVHPSHRTIAVLEGGYDLEALADSVAATLRGLAGTVPDGEAEPETSAILAIEEAAAAVSRHWDL